MPPLPSVNKVLRINHFYTIGGDTAVMNRVFAQYGNIAFTNTNCNSLATTVAAAWATRFQALAFSDTTLNSIQVIDLTSSSAAEGSALAGTTGTRAGHTLPAAAAVVLQMAIARRYRGGHPRLYMHLGAAEDLTTSQQWSAAFLASVAGAWAGYLSDIKTAVAAISGPANNVNVSYFQGFTNVTSPSGRTRPRPTVRGVPVVDVVTGSSVNSKMGSQRRRNKQSA